MRRPAMKIWAIYVLDAFMYTVPVLDYNGCTAMLNFINRYVS
jgi:hypothetical protein